MAISNDDRIKIARAVHDANVREAAELGISLIKRAPVKRRGSWSQDPCVQVKRKPRAGSLFNIHGD